VWRLGGEVGRREGKERGRRFRALGAGGFAAREECRGIGRGGEGGIEGGGEGESDGAVEWGGGGGGGGRGGWECKEKREVEKVSRGGKGGRGGVEKGKRLWTGNNHA